MTEPIIEFKDFSFKYNSQAEPTLKNINLKINKGEKILLGAGDGSALFPFAAGAFHCVGIRFLGKGLRRFISGSPLRRRRNTGRYAFLIPFADSRVKMFSWKEIKNTLKSVRSML